MYSLIIVEDDDNIRDGLVNLFPWEDAGFQVKADFSNGLSAWDYLKEHPDTTAVLTDIRMPVMDGIELSGKIYETYPGISVYLLSGYQDFSYAQSAIRYNVRDFFVKPVKHQTLLLSFLKLKEELEREGNIPEETIPVNQYYSQIIRNVKTYIAENLATANLEEAAANSHLSSSYMSRLFKSYMSVSFSEYLLKVRMEQARILLSDVRNKIYEVSDAIGYDNPKNFTRAFRNYYQMTPKEFREKGETYYEKT